MTTDGRHLVKPASCVKQNTLFVRWGADKASAGRWQTGNPTGNTYNQGEKAAAFNWEENEKKEDGTSKADHVSMRDSQALEQGRADREEMNQGRVYAEVTGAEANLEAPSEGVSDSWGGVMTLLTILSIDFPLLH